MHIYFWEVAWTPLLGSIWLQLWASGNLWDSTCTSESVFRLRVCSSPVLKVASLAWVFEESVKETIYRALSVTFSLPPSEISAHIWKEMSSSASGGWGSPVSTKSYSKGADWDERQRKDFEYCSEFWDTLENHVLSILVKLFTIGNVPTIPQVSHGNSTFSRQRNFHSRNTTTYNQSSCCIRGQHASGHIIPHVLTWFGRYRPCIGFELRLERLVTGIVNIFVHISPIYPMLMDTINLQMHYSPDLTPKFRSLLGTLLDRLRGSTDGRSRTDVLPPSDILDLIFITVLRRASEHGTKWKQPPSYLSYLLARRVGHIIQRTVRY